MEKKITFEVIADYTFLVTYTEHLIINGKKRHLPKTNKYTSKHTKKNRMDNSFSFKDPYLNFWRGKVVLLMLFS